MSLDDAGSHAAREASPRDRRTVTVVFADIVGSTELIGNDAEEAHALLAPALGRMARVLERYSGTVAKRMGDGLMALFGIPVAQEDHAVRACHAALELQAEMQRHAAEIARSRDVQLRVRVGIHSGAVVVSEAGEGERAEYDATGPSVHLAARIEKVAPPGEVCLSEATFRTVRKAFECEPLGPHQLKGFAGAQLVYKLRRPKKLAAADAETGPFVGRDEQIAALLAACRRVEEGSGGTVLVTGDAGVGKTRLLHEMRQQQGDEVFWLEGHALSFGQRLSYWPFVEMLRAHFHLGEGDVAPGWHALERQLRATASDELVEALPYFATLLGVEIPPPDDERVRYLDGEALGKQIFRAVHRLFSHLAAIRPVVLVFEDLHWIDGSSAGLLEHLLRLTAEKSLLVVVLSRPEAEMLPRLREAASRGGADRLIELALPPLSVGESERLIEAFLGPQRDTRRVRDLILYKAEGNPFFIEEVIRTLVDTSVLVREDEGGRWSVRDQPIAIPDTIEGVIMARFDRLDERLRQVLSVASVIGRSFLYRVLHAVADHAHELDDRLARLKALELIAEMKSAPELAYLFRHALAQETIYQSLLKERRHQLHERIAECLQTIYAERASEITSVLAYHYVRAERWDKALHYLLLAAEQSTRMAADDEALLLYEEALDAYSRAFAGKWDRAQHATIERRLAEIYVRRGDHDRARRHLAKALALFGDRLEPGLPLKLAIGAELLRQGAHRAFARFLLPSPREATQAADDAHYRLYEVTSWLYMTDDQERLLLSVLRILNLAERSGLAEGVAKASGAAGFACDIMGMPQLARFYHERALRLATQFANPATTALARHLIGIHFFFRGDWEPAGARLRMARENAERAGDLMTVASAMMLESELLCEQGRLRSALLHGEAMLRLGREAAFQPAERWGLAACGLALRRLGRRAEARAVFEQSLAQSLERSDWNNFCLVAGELGLLHLEEGALPEALGALAEGDATGRRYRIHSHTRTPIRLGLAAAALRQFETAPDAASRRAARRASRAALRNSARFAFGLPGALRLAGTFAWLCGRKRSALASWQRSLAAAERLGAEYERALTLLEMGERLHSVEQLDCGSGLLARLRQEESRPAAA